MSKPDGGPMFPCVTEYIDEEPIRTTGLTKREWYAGMALQGMLANKVVLDMVVATVEAAFDFADVMIAEGSKE